MKAQRPSPGNGGEDSTTTASNEAPVRERCQDEGHQPVELVQELRIESTLVPHRRGELYRLAAERIEELEGHQNVAPSYMDEPTMGLKDAPDSAEGLLVPRALILSFAENRCYACNWPLHESAETGCVPFNCSFRPHEGSDEYAPWLKRAKEMWAISDKAHLRQEPR